MLQKPVVSEETLRAFLQEQYDISPVTIEMLPLGLDTLASVYRVVSERGASYFLKVKSGTLYEPTCLVPGYLRDQGITAVVAPLPTKSNALWTQVEEWTAILYPFLDGDTSWTGMSDEQWRQTGRIFKQIHSVMVPPEGFQSLRVETFDPTGYAHWVRKFEAEHVHLEGGERHEQELRLHWRAHQSTIDTVVTAMEKLAVVLQERSGPKVICHADLHPANLLRDQAGCVFVIDWDDVMLAPKEHDFLFVGDPRADDAPQQEPSPFFQGYGETEVDWVAITYYRYERVIQDVIAFAQEVLLRDDLTEESKVDSVRLFHANLAEGGEIDVARAAAAHLPSDLGLHNQ